MVMKIKSLFGYAAAMSLLAWGFSACTEENPENPDDNGGGTTSTIRYRVSVDDESITENSVTVNVTCNGTESDTWYAFITDDLDSPTKNVIAAAVDALTDVASALRSGNDAVKFSGLTANTDYRVVVTGLLSDGTVTGTPDEDEFTTSRDANTWETNPNWSVTYNSRGTFETLAGSMYGDLIDVTVTNDDLGYWYLSTVTVSDFESTYHNNAAEYINSVITELNALIEENNQMYPEYPVAILDLIYQGSGSIIHEPLEDTPHYAFAIGIEPAGTTGEGSGLYAQSESFSPAVEEASDQFNYWLGSWEVTGDNDIVDTLTVVSYIPNYQYTVLGWQDGLMDSDNVGIPASFDAASGNMTLEASENLGFSFTDENYGQINIVILGFVDGDDLGGQYAGNEVRITGAPYDVAAATPANTTPTTDETVNLVGQNIQLSGNMTADFIGMQYYGNVVSGGALYWDIISPSFPATMKRIGENTSSSDSADIRSTYSSICTLKTVPAALKTMSPLKTVYKAR